MRLAGGTVVTKARPNTVSVGHDGRVSFPQQGRLAVRLLWPFYAWDGGGCPGSSQVRPTHLTGLEWRLYNPR